ncbi:MAG TPA: endonuclease/exonuclease/phosphatase family protein [Pirellulaceae bacterium]|jgi:endonuclease/exonuclease/phosphatase family metal-dependent hydrolase|nr:endonuclease/exonuclease/phosphatase family protein [Pirellulaceae bacterium]
MLRTRILTLLLVGAALAIPASMGVAHEPAEAEVLQTSAAPEKAVRVMSFNIRYGSANDGENRWDLRKDFVVDTIEAFDPDLLGTQETLLFQRQFLEENLDGYEAWGVGREDGKEAGEQTTLFYKTERFERLDAGHFWLSETPETPGSKSWDSSLPRMASWVKLRDRQDADAKPLLFVNTHFDHRGAEARRQSAKLIREQVGKLGEGSRVVLTGDFNAGEASPPYVALFGETNGEASPLRDTYRLAHPDRRDDEGSFSSFVAGAKQGARIDWIGASSDFAVHSAAIDRTERDGRTPSDHFPVTAVLVAAGDAASAEER